MPALLPLEQRRISDLLLRQVDERPDAVFLEFPRFSTRWTYAEFLADARRIAGALRELGLQPGDRVGIMLDNRPEYVLTWLGSVIAGTIDVSINHGLRSSGLSHQLRLAGIRAVVCDSSSALAIRDVLPDVPSLDAVILTDGKVQAPGVLVRSFDSLLGADGIDRHPSSPTETTSIRYTSGTTGPSKAVARTHSALVVHCAHFVWLTAYGPDDVLYTCFPLHHGIASGLGVVTTLLAGGRLIVDERFSASSYWARIREHDASLAHIISPLVPILLSQPASPLDREHRCRRLWTAPPSAAFEQRFGSRLIYFYGLAEGGTIAYTPPGERAPAGSSGRPSPLFEVRIVDEVDHPVAPGVEGEIVWRPTEPHLMTPGYVGDPAATVRAWRGLWFHSGDLGRLDEAGYLYLHGRTGDQIRRKGVNISAEEVEAAALEHEGVVEAAAIAVPAPLGESEVKLCVVPHPDDFEVSRLRAHLAATLPAEMVPRFLEVRDALPRTDTHKIAKAELRKEGDRGLTPATMDFEPRRSGGPTARPGPGASRKDRA